MAEVRRTTVFTTHTPVPAGIDLYEPTLMYKYFQKFYHELGLTRDEFIGIGRARGRARGASAPASSPRSPVT